MAPWTALSRRIRFPVALSVAGVALLIAAPGCSGRANPARVDQRPNFVVILTDDQELASVASMTRTLDLIGSNGVTFSNYTVPLSLCCPSRATILTGMYPHRHRVVANFAPDGGFSRFAANGLEDSTLATALRASGYRTALFGKYLNGYPNAGDSTHVPAGWVEWASPVGGGPYGQYNYTLNSNGTLETHRDGAQDYLTDVIAKRSVEFVKRASKGDAPFFLLASVYAPHLPATPAARHADAFAGERAPRTPSFDEDDVSDKPARVRALPRLPAKAVRMMDATWRRKLQSLQAVDELVVAIVTALEKSGQLENTWIVFTSDNGFHFGQHRMATGKYTAYESDVHVPLIVRGPGATRGRVIDLPVASVDLAPTLAELAGAALPALVDGRSLAPLLRGELPAPWRQVSLLEQFDFPPGEHPVNGPLEPGDPQDTLATVGYPSHIGLRSPHFKYIEYKSGEQEVYDLFADPDETRNLAPTVGRAWLTRASRLARSLAACVGDGCRTLETQLLAVPQSPRPD